MKKFLLLLVVLLAILPACDSSKKSDKGSATVDADQISTTDQDSKATDEDEDKDKPDGNETGKDADTDKNDADVDNGNTNPDPCIPNPCDTEENKKTHRIECNLDDKAENGYVCDCDKLSNYHEDNGLCCTEHASNKNGECVCEQYYTMKDGRCVLDEKNPCNPNPCDTPENQKLHLTDCKLDSSVEKGFVCECSYNGGYHEDNGICCPGNSTNVNGTCECKEGYTKDPEGDKCLINCGQLSNEALTGYCEDGKFCQQGVCIDNACKDVTCPEKSTCSTKNNEAFCRCEDGLHMSNNLCCHENSSNTNGTCVCDEGYEEVDGKCKIKETNPCKEDQNPCKEYGKNVCTPDSSPEGYRCSCNAGYEENEGKCKEILAENCPDGFQCLNSVCVNLDTSKETCITDSDCREFGGNAICIKTAAGGTCQGCNSASDCPGNHQCVDGYQTCALMCSDDNDCPYGRCSTRGYCIKTRCSSDEDCFNGTRCNGSGWCDRIPCRETKCSEFNPNGTCENANETCLGGKCVSSCNPNVCEEIALKEAADVNNIDKKNINKTVCEIIQGKPQCLCAEGTELDDEGKCVPKVAKCPSGFTCENKRCVNRNDINFICAADSDCVSGTKCNNALPTGMCNGCTTLESCNHGTTCVTLSSTNPNYNNCMAGCQDDSDCHQGMKCKAGMMKCTKRECSSPTDCGVGLTCTENGRCERQHCGE